MQIIYLDYKTYKNFKLKLRTEKQFSDLGTIIKNYRTGSVINNEV